MAGWLRHWSKSDDFAARVVCFPPAGGGAHFYWQWAELCSPEIGVVGVEFPGHGARLSEPPETDITALVTGPLLDEVESLLDRPVAVFGHSMGALVGLDMCHELQRRRGWHPPLFVAAGCAEPDGRHIPENATDLTDQEVAQYLRENEGTPPALLEDEEYLPLIAKVIRADFALVASRSPVIDRPLGCTIRAYVGRADTGVRAEDVAGWEEQSNGDFATRSFHGGHFFPQENAADVLRSLSNDLAAVLRVSASTVNRTEP